MAYGNQKYAGFPYAGEAAATIIELLSKLLAIKISRQAVGRGSLW